MKINNNKTRKNSLSQQFQREITKYFLEILIMVKLFHWNTFDYSLHKATDELYSKLNENIDTFIEILLGKNNFRIHFINKNNRETPLLISVKNINEFKREIIKFKIYLDKLNTNDKFMTYYDGKTNSDLLNIRDTIVGDVNKFLYLSTLR